MPPGRRVWCKGLGFRVQSLGSASRVSAIELKVFSSGLMAKTFRDPKNKGVGI